MFSKKGVAILLSFYYVVICIGLTVTLHFCGGVLESLSTSSDIAKCEMTAKTSCCSQKKIIQILKVVVAIILL
jgi:hypothetical protein